MLDRIKRKIECEKNVFRGQRNCRIWIKLMQREFFHPARDGNK